MVELAEELVEEGPSHLRVKLPEVDGDYQLTCSPALVQAAGKCCGVNFYLRAKYGKWEFETEDEHGHPYPLGDPRRFALRDYYDEAKPGAMELEWAARRLRRCLSEWWST